MALRLHDMDGRRCTAVQGAPSSLPESLHMLVSATTRNVCCFAVQQAHAKGQTEPQLRRFEADLRLWQVGVA